MVWVQIVFIFILSVELHAQEDLDFEQLVEPDSVFEKVDECDLLAAHPDDPRRMAQGVADDEIVPLLAIEACEKALKLNPDELRFALQLGRALLAFGEKKKAFEIFEKTAGKGYAGAQAYLGDAYQFGLGTEMDTKKALENYEAAIKGGFEVAEGQVKKLQFDGSIFVSAGIRKLYAGDFNYIQENSDKAFRNYLFNFSQELIEECDSFLKPQGVVGMFFYRYPKGWTVESDESIIIAIQTSVGEFDARVFLKRHSCEGPVAEQFFKNLDKFYQLYLP